MNTPPCPANRPAPVAAAVKARSRGIAAAALVCAAALLAGCGSSGTSGGNVQQPAPRYDTSQVPPYLPKDLLTDTSKPAEKVKVALLLPLSGQHAAIGEALLKASQMAVFDVADDNFTLVPLDTQGTPDGAAEATRTALRQNVKLILGPLLSTSVRAASNATRGTGVNIIAFSNDQMVAGNGVYLMGFLPGQEVQRAVAYASSRGLRRMGAFAPDSPYGRLAVGALQSSASRYGGTVARTIIVPENPASVASGAREFAQGDSYDAILLPFSGPALNDVARQLQSAGIEPSRTKFLGTSQWDHPSNTLYQEPLLNGGWFALVPPEKRAEFERRYASNYGGKPPRIATLAYDATALTALIAKSPNARFDQQAITNPRGFAGADGYFRFRPDGTADRGLAIMEVVPGGLRIVDPAPTRAEDLSS
ncbi:branched-chain amino acid transport system substrate-binding protein [Constrictibacter sp. MBR-5]|uniref:penicillin-binding protein activator n=1 Tax=Constrictibacter sp. MBR-5 TaxID=3156467 RepID=UPI0033998B4A